RPSRRGAARERGRRTPSPAAPPSAALPAAFGRAGGAPSALPAIARPGHPGAARVAGERAAEALLPVAVGEPALAARLVGGQDIGVGGAAAAEGDLFALEEQGHLALDVERAADLEIDGVELADDRRRAAADERGAGPEVDERERGRRRRGGEEARAGEQGVLRLSLAQGAVHEEQ